MDDLRHETTANTEKSFSRIRDVWTNRIIGWTTGAFIPVLLLMIPIVNRWMDDSKELDKLRIANELVLNQLSNRVALLEIQLDFCNKRCEVK